MARRASSAAYGSRSKLTRRAAASTAGPSRWESGLTVRWSSRRARSSCRAARPRAPDHRPWRTFALASPVSTVKATGEDDRDRRLRVVVSGATSGWPEPARGDVTQCEQARGRLAPAVTATCDPIERLSHGVICVQRCRLVQDPALAY
jgi:hypothetical protein